MSLQYTFFLSFSLNEIVLYNVLVETSSNSVAQPASVTYIGSIPCGKEILVNEMESIFQQKVKEQVCLNRPNDI